MAENNVKYVVNKYAGKVYCGNALFNTLEECIVFIRDGFCDKGDILDTTTNEIIKIKITRR